MGEPNEDAQYVALTVALTRDSSRHAVVFVM